MKNNMRYSTKFKRIKKITFLFIICLVQTTIFAQDDVSIGKSRKFQSKILGGEVTFLVHLPDGYENSGITR
jgi:hypothetical protein